MGKKPMPIGTQRVWDDGNLRVIKAHENSIFSSGWIPVDHDSRLEALGKELDSVARLIKGFKEPIDGELFLDHEIEEFEKDDQGNHPFNPHDFKKYEGFYGAGRYSFTNELTRRFMDKKIQIASKVNDELLSANGDDDVVKLSDHDKKAIRKRVRDEFKNDDDNYNIIKQGHKLLEIVNRTYEQLKKGTNFDDPKQKEVYENAIKVAKELPDNYERIGIKRALKNATFDKVNETFKDNWGIRESVNKLLNDKYGEFVRYFAEQIAHDEALDQEALFGVKLDDDPDTFYKGLFEKLNSKTPIDFSKYIGHTFTRKSGERDVPVVLYRNESNGVLYVNDKADFDKQDFRYAAPLNDEKRIKDQIESQIRKLEFVGDFSSLNEKTFSYENRKYEIEVSKKDSSKIIGFYPLDENGEAITGIFQGDTDAFDELLNHLRTLPMYTSLQKEDDYPFKELIYLRFETKYGKQLDGDWRPEMLPAIYNIEKLMTTLPAGHFRTNSYLRLITNKDYSGGEGYAYFNPSDKRINFSDKAANPFQIYGDLKGRNEFNSVCAHEIGHSVSYKLGRAKVLDYKKFVKECGWSYQQFEWKDKEFQATGNDPDIAREGSMASVPLLTKYAHKSPEEAFAEYYSIYANNRKEIDTWLDTGNEDALKKESLLIAPEIKEGDLVDLSTYYSYTKNADTSKISEAFESLNRNIDDHVKIELVNPWHASYTLQGDSIVSDASQIKSGLFFARQKSVMPAVYIKKDLKNFVCISNEKINQGCKYTKKFCPGITITKETYDALSKKGFTKGEIIDFATKTLIDKGTKVPVQSTEPVFKKGIAYRLDILDYKDVVKNKNRFEAMRKIFNSEALAKALRELFTPNDIESIFVNDVSVDKEPDGLILKAKVDVLLNNIQDSIEIKIGNNGGEQL